MVTQVQRRGPGHSGRRSVVCVWSVPRHPPADTVQAITEAAERRGAELAAHANTVQALTRWNTGPRGPITVDSLIPDGIVVATVEDEDPV